MNKFEVLKNIAIIENQLYRNFPAELAKVSVVNDYALLCYPVTYKYSIIESPLGTLFKRSWMVGNLLSQTRVLNASTSGFWVYFVKLDDTYLVISGSLKQKRFYLASSQEEADTIMMTYTMLTSK